MPSRIFDRFLSRGERSGLAADNVRLSRVLLAGYFSVLLTLFIMSIATFTVGQKVNEIVKHHVEIVSLTDRLRHYGEAEVLYSKLAALSGDEATAQRYRETHSALRETLAELSGHLNAHSREEEKQVLLEQFQKVDAADQALAEVELRAIDFARSTDSKAAAALLDSDEYRRMNSLFKDGLAAIKRVSEVTSARLQADIRRYFAIDVFAVFFGLLVMAAVWFLVIQPVRRFGDQLYLARKEAESATQAKTEFLAVMSHEIRTPLSSILGFTGLLLNRKSDPESRHWIELIRNAGAMLLTIVNDILDFAKMEAGEIELNPTGFSISSLIDNTVSLVHTEASRKGLALDVATARDVPPFVVGDEDRLRQILLNLLNNAIKFTARGSIGLRVTREGSSAAGERLCFSVTDTGIGIPRDKQPRIFDRFVQVNASISREYGGTGLGLAISKRLVELMGGEIGVRSVEGQGAEFWFTLILPVADGISPTAAEGEAVATRPGRILLVEDHEPNQIIARAILEHAGHKVDVAADGSEALSAVRERRYDVVLMDVHMPRVDGITATRLIRQLDGPARRVPIIAMTANVLPQQVAQFKEAGMDEHVGKPFQPAALLRALARWMPASAGDDAERAEEPVAAAAPVFDRAVFDRLEMMGEVRLRGIMRTFEEQLRDRADEAELDRSRLAKRAHTLISQAGMLGFMELSERFAEIEEACLADADLSVPLARLREARARALEAMQSVFPDSARRETERHANG